MLSLKIYFALEKINNSCTLFTVYIESQQIYQIKISPLKSGLDPAATDVPLASLRGSHSTSSGLTSLSQREH